MSNEVPEGTEGVEPAAPVEPAGPDDLADITEPDEPGPHTLEPGLGDAEPTVFEDADDDIGDDVPHGDELTDEELAAIRLSQSDPNTPPADAEVG